MRAQSHTAGPVVTLGDVADIEFADPQQTAALAAIELFPAPAPGEQRVVPVREIQDLLLLRGVNLTEHRFLGASEVAIQTVVARPAAAVSGPISVSESQRIKRRVSEALVKYLSEHAASAQTWAVEFTLSDTQARSLADPVRPIEVSGGIEPWTGSQRFALTVAGPKGPLRATIEADVRIVAPVVVAVRSLSRGDVIRPGDVDLRQVVENEKTGGALLSVEEAVGHELVRPVSAGRVVSAESLRQPLAVRRGDVVTVYAQSDGIRIRTNARARDEGSVGELVAVESLLNRSVYYARVSGVREVEVFARSQKVEDEPTEASAAGIAVRH